MVCTELAFDSKKKRKANDCVHIVTYLKYSLSSNGRAHPLRGDAGSNPAVSKQKKENIFIFEKRVFCLFLYKTAQIIAQFRNYAVLFFLFGTTHRLSNKNRHSRIVYNLLTAGFEPASPRSDHLS